MARVPTVELWLWKQMTGIFGGHLQTTLQWDPHHLQTTHPLPKNKQGRYSFFPQGWNLFRPKLSTKFCLAAQPISDSLSFDTLVVIILWAFNTIHLYHSYPNVVCQYHHDLHCRQSDSFVVTAPGPYWVVICQQACLGPRSWYLKYIGSIIRHKSNRWRWDFQEM